MEEVKHIVANNLSDLRKSKGLTQQQLAEIFSYSDKSISKWEHGETLPDIDTLKRVCDYYGITLDYLVTEKSNEEKRLALEKDNAEIKTNKKIVTALAISWIWILATVIFVALYLISKVAKPNESPIVFWMAFVWAFPASILCLIFFNKKWGGSRLSSILIIAFIWTFLSSVYLQTGLTAPGGWSTWALFFLGLPVTIAIILLGKIKNKKGGKNV